MNERVGGWMKGRMDVKDWLRIATVAQKTLLEGWKDGWVEGCKSRVKDCLQQSKIKAIFHQTVHIFGGAYMGSCFHLSSPF